MPAGGDPDEILVVDASVVIAVVSSTGRDARVAADRVMGRRVHAPSILPTEVDSALRGLERGGVLSTGQADAARIHARMLSMELWPWEVIADRAWELRANLTTYDAGYVALAEQLGAVLLTGDSRLERAGVARCVVELINSDGFPDER